MHYQGVDFRTGVYGVPIKDGGVTFLGIAFAPDRLRGLPGHCVQEGQHLALLRMIKLVAPAEVTE